MFVACGIWCLADVSSVSPSSEQTVCLYKPDVKHCSFLRRNIPKNLNRMVRLYKSFLKLVGVFHVR